MHGDQDRFEGPQQNNRAYADNGQPERKMHPDGWLERGFQPERQSDDNSAENQDHEHRRAVACIVRRKIDTAMIATITHVQQILEEFALAASGAFAPQSGRD